MNKLYIVLISLLLTCLTTASAQWTQLGNDIDGEATGDRSGNTVEMSTNGAVVAIGAEFNAGNNANNSETGHVRVYQLTGGNWVQKGVDLNGEAAGDHSAIDLSLSKDGNILAIGAYNNGGTASGAGHVRVYEWNGTAWIQKGSDIDGEAAFNRFGYSLSMTGDGSTLVIGAPRNNDGGTRAGQARVYDWNGTTWVQRGADIDGAAARDEFGTTVGINENGMTIAIGAPFNDGNGSDAGHVRVYDWNGTAWVQKGTAINGEAAFDFSGGALELNANGEALIIGASRNRDNGLAAGHARVYSWNGTAWTQQGADLDGETAGDEAGFAVSMDSVGHTIAVGAYKNSGNGNTSGHTRVYKWNGTSWNQYGADIDGEHADNYGGYAIDLNPKGTLLAIGAPRNDGNGTYSGHVRMYTSCANPATGVDIQTSCDSYTWLDGNTYTTSNNTATITLTNAAGCDSVVTLDLTINNSSAGVDIQTSCDSYTWLDGITYTTSNNTATITLTNAAGCDSVVTLDLTINNSSAGVDAQTACDSYTWLDGNTYTTSNNTATITLTNAAGCDSVVTLDLTINNSTAGVDIQTSCDSYTWLDGITYTTSNNTATITLTNAAGCDSVVTLDLTINTVNVSTQTTGNSITANAVGAMYQWIDCNNTNATIAGATNSIFTPTTDGNYGVIVTENGCVDTSTCVSFTGTALQQLPTGTFQMSVYPNPTTGVFTLDLGAVESAKVQIFAANGQLIQQQLIQGQGVHQLELEGAAGVYFLQIQVGNQLQYSKLIKK